MAIESANYISQLDITQPPGTDSYSTVDNHLRLVKKVAIQSFSNINSEVSATPGALNQMVGIQSNVQDQINAATSSIAALSQSLTTEMRNLSANLKSQLNSVSATLDAKIETLSSTLNTQMQDLSSTLYTEIRAVSASLQTLINDTESSINATKLGISATAVSAALWGSATKYVQTATPALSNGDIWFQPTNS